MRSLIEWQTGSPTEYGDYLVIKKSRIDGSMKVEYNVWLTDVWQIASPDACDIIAWANIDNIKIEEL